MQKIKFSLLWSFCLMVCYSMLVPPSYAGIKAGYGEISLSFIKNKGQLNKQVKFYEKGSGHSTYFTADAIYFTLSRKDADISDSQIENKKEVWKTDVVKLSVLGGNKDKKIVSENRLKGTVNYFTGKNKKKWQTGIPTYKAVVYKNIYKNVDMRFYGNKRQLEYDVIVKPGADPSIINLSYDGIKEMKIAKNGNMEMLLDKSKLTQKRPYIYQDIKGKRVEIAGSFKIKKQDKGAKKSKEFIYGFQVAAYDKSYPLVIDPIISYSTYLAATGTYLDGNTTEYAKAIAVDNLGNAYVTGVTQSTNFPMENPIQGTHNGGYDDVFITKIDPSGSEIIYSTYLGGSGRDIGIDIAVDDLGNMYITGHTTSQDFPLVNPIKSTLNNYDRDAFITKLDASGGNIVYSTYLGGSLGDRASGIALDNAGNAYISGWAISADFPIVNPLPGSGIPSRDSNGFITKINADGSAFIFSTYLSSGNRRETHAKDIAVDSSGNVYITGTTQGGMPVVNAIQDTCNWCGKLYYGGGRDVFVTKLDSTGTNVLFSTYLGGDSADTGYAIAVDNSENIYITGDTHSPYVLWDSGAQDKPFPSTGPIPPMTVSCNDKAANGYSAFAAKIDSSYNLVYSTCLEIEAKSTGRGIVADSAGNAYITGETRTSVDFPIVDPIQGVISGQRDAFVTVINSDGSGFLFSDYLGGWLDDYGYGITLDEVGDLYIAGRTVSSDFPTTAGSFQENDHHVTGTNADMVSVGRGYTCIVENNKVNCWGGSNNTQATTVPNGLVNPSQVSADSHTCAVDDNGVTCWGGNAWQGQTTVPDGLINPSQVSTGNNHTCAVDDNGITCWGSDGYGKSTVPIGLVNPSQVSAGQDHTCTLDDSGVSCWGRDSYGQSTVPAGLINPSQVSAGSRHTCAIDDNGVTCWGRDNAGQSTVPAGLVNPRQVSAGSGHTCAVDDNGLMTCWGSYIPPPIPVNKSAFITKITGIQP